jgi:tetraacyldisaccharide 4'-kinase
MQLEPPAWWYEGHIPIAAWALWPLAALYGRLVQQRFRAASPYRSRLPVICVGNFTVGGAGKTPVALKLAFLLRDMGNRPAFLTRGYGGRERGPHLIDDAADDSDRVGDEPLLLARCAQTVVSWDRPAGAKLIEALPADIIIMDDGFQNPSLKKDFSLVVVDGGSGIGSGKVFPLGPMRAPLPFQVAMANAILVLGAQGRKDPIALGFQAPDVPFYEADVVPAVAEDMLASPVLAFCGIGRPPKFFDTLRKAGVAVAQSRPFPDHYRYTEADARSLIAEARALRARLLTTEKDHIRLRGKGGALGELYRTAAALPISIEFLGDSRERLMRSISAAIRRA